MIVFRRRKLSTLDLLGLSFLDLEAKFVVLKVGLGCCPWNPCLLLPRFELPIRPDLLELLRQPREFPYART
jgi:hypothetical protein